MNGLTVALGYIGGYANFALAVPRILMYYRPRRDAAGKLRVEGVRAITFTHRPGDSGAANHAMLKRFGNDLLGHHVVGHAQDLATGKMSFTFRVFVPADRAGWARDLFAYNGCVVDGMPAATNSARVEHGLPRPWSDGPRPPEQVAAMRNNKALAQQATRPPQAVTRRASARRRLTARKATRKTTLRERIADWL